MNGRFNRTDEGELADDAVVEANRHLLLKRSQVGLSKYGSPLTRDDLSQRDWLVHALEEALDLANYLQAAIMKIDRDEDDWR